MDSLPKGDHRTAMMHCMEQAKKSLPQPTNFRVGAMIVNLGTDEIVARGFTLELPGNTHAEECCLLKLADKYSTSEDKLSRVMQGQYALYTTVEPCYKRLSGKQPCVERILQQKSWIKEVHVGVLEPVTFVGFNPGHKKLQDGGVLVNFVEGLEEEILKIATAGHLPKEDL